MKKQLTVLLAILLIASCIPLFAYAEETDSQVQFVLVHNGDPDIIAPQGGIVTFDFYINRSDIAPDEEYTLWSWSVWINFDPTMLQFLSCTCEPTSMATYGAGDDVLIFSTGMSYGFAYTGEQKIATLKFKILSEYDTHTALTFSNAGTLCPHEDGVSFEVAKTKAFDVQFDTFTVFSGDRKSYYVKYVDGVDGEAFADQNYVVAEDGYTPVFIGTPTREHYRFVGWETKDGGDISSVVTKDTTYIAQWERLFSVTYTDGVDGTAFDTQVFQDISGGAYTPAFIGTPTRSGYVFDGWKDADGNDVAQTVTADATYIAQWHKQASTFTVTYTDGVNGTAFEDQIFEVAKDAPTPDYAGTPKRDGYNFVGWGSVAPSVTDNVTYTAQWQQKCCPWCFGGGFCPWCWLLPLIVLIISLLVIVAL